MVTAAGAYFLYSTAPYLAAGVAGFFAAKYASKKIYECYNSYMNPPQEDVKAPKTSISQDYRADIVNDTIAEEFTGMKKALHKIKEIFMKIFNWVKNCFFQKEQIPDTQSASTKSDSHKDEGTEIDEGASTKDTPLETYENLIQPRKIPANAFDTPNYLPLEGSIEGKRNYLIGQAKLLIPGEEEMCASIAENLIPKADHIQEIEFDPATKAFKIQLNSKLSGKIKSLDGSATELKGVSSTTKFGLTRATLSTESDVLTGRFVNTAIVFGDQELKLAIPWVASYYVTAILPFDSSFDDKVDYSGVRLGGADPKNPKNKTWIEVNKPGFSYIFKHLEWSKA